MSSSSIRNRLFLVIAGTALLAALSIGITYVATEPARLNAVSDAHTVASLYSEAVALSEAIRDQEAAIDDYLLTRGATAIDGFTDAVELEVRLEERMKLEAVEHPGIVNALQSLGVRTQGWRTSFAEPAIAAVDHGSPTEIAGVTETVVTVREQTTAGIGDLVTQISAAETSVAVNEDALSATRALAGGIGLILMLLAAAASLVLARRWVTQPLGRLLTTANDVEAGGNVAFAPDRNDEIGRLGTALERMRSALQNDADRSSILNRFTEVTTFAHDDAAVAAATLEALRMLVQPDAAVTHVLNHSKDRAMPEATIGEAAAEVLPLNTLSRCPAIVRGSIYVTADASEPLSVQCPVYRVEGGTLACVPLAHGETVGAVHLHWARRDAFSLDLRSSVARVAEHAALAISNRRLLAALQGMASTDARTGLANTRAFDQSLEDALRSRRDDETVAVLMLDLDHFKDFNDRYGHPAGDEALRAFGDILRSSLRDGDVAARYGGEEFAVALPAADEATALAIAERIRSRTESTVISLAPGISDRITVSIGVASAPHQANDRLSLLRLADEALYEAKVAGRNRVVRAGGSTVKDAEQPSTIAQLRRPPKPAVHRIRREARTRATS